MLDPKLNGIMHKIAKLELGIANQLGLSLRLARIVAKYSRWTNLAVISTQNQAKYI